MCHTQALHPLAASAKRAARLSLLLCSHPGLQELLQVRSFSRWQRGSQAERCCSYPVLSEQGHMWRGQEAQLHHKAGCALGTPPSSSSGVLQWATMILGGLLNSGRRSVVVQILNQQAFRFINDTFFFFLRWPLFISFYLWHTSFHTSYNSVLQKSWIPPFEDKTSQEFWSFIRCANRLRVYIFPLFKYFFSTNTPHEVFTAET